MVQPISPLSSPQIPTQFFSCSSSPPCTPQIKEREWDLSCDRLMEELKSKGLFDDFGSFIGDFAKLPPLPPLDYASKERLAALLTERQKIEAGAITTEITLLELLNIYPNDYTYLVGGIVPHILRAEYYLRAVESLGVTSARDLVGEEMRKSCDSPKNDIDVRSIDGNFNYKLIMDIRDYGLTLLSHCSKRNGLIANVTKEEVEKEICKNRLRIVINQGNCLLSFPVGKIDLQYVQMQSRRSLFTRDDMGIRLPKMQHIDELQQMKIVPTGERRADNGLGRGWLSIFSRMTMSLTAENISTIDSKGWMRLIALLGDGYVCSNGSRDIDSMRMKLFDYLLKDGKDMLNGYIALANDIILNHYNGDRLKCCFFHLNSSAEYPNLTSEDGWRSAIASLSPSPDKVKGSVAQSLVELLLCRDVPLLVVRALIVLAAPRQLLRPYDTKRAVEYTFRLHKRKEHLQLRLNEKGKLYTLLLPFDYEGAARVVEQYSKTRHCSLASALLLKFWCALNEGNAVTADDESRLAGRRASIDAVKNIDFCQKSSFGRLLQLDHKLVAFALSSERRSLEQGLYIHFVDTLAAFGEEERAKVFESFSPFFGAHLPNYPLPSLELLSSQKGERAIVTTLFQTLIESEKAPYERGVDKLLFADIEEKQALDHTALLIYAVTNRPAIPYLQQWIEKGWRSGILESTKLFLLLKKNGVVKQAILSRFINSKEEALRELGFQLLEGLCIGEKSKKVLLQMKPHLLLYGDELLKNGEFVKFARLKERCASIVDLHRPLQDRELARHLERGDFDKAIASLEAVECSKKGEEGITPLAKYLEKALEDEDGNGAFRKIALLFENKTVAQHLAAEEKIIQKILDAALEKIAADDAFLEEGHRLILSILEKLYGKKPLEGGKRNKELFALTFALLMQKFLIVEREFPPFTSQQKESLFSLLPLLDRENEPFLLLFDQLDRRELIGRKYRDYIPLLIAACSSPFERDGRAACQTIASLLAEKYLVTHRTTIKSEQERISLLFKNLVDFSVNSGSSEGVKRWITHYRNSPYASKLAAKEKSALIEKWVDRLRKKGSLELASLVVENFSSEKLELAPLIKSIVDEWMATDSWEKKEKVLSFLEKTLVKNRKAAHELRSLCEEMIRSLLKEPLSQKMLLSIATLYEAIGSNDEELLVEYIQIAKNCQSLFPVVCLGVDAKTEKMIVEERDLAVREVKEKALALFDVLERKRKTPFGDDIIGEVSILRTDLSPTKFNYLYLKNISKAIKCIEKKREAIEASTLHLLCHLKRKAVITSGEINTLFAIIDSKEFALLFPAGESMRHEFELAAIASTIQTKDPNILLHLSERFNRLTKELVKKTLSDKECEMVNVLIEKCLSLAGSPLWEIPPFFEGMFRLIGHEKSERLDLYIWTFLCLQYVKAMIIPKYDKEMMAISPLLFNIMKNEAIKWKAFPPELRAILPCELFPKSGTSYPYMFSYLAFYWIEQGTFEIAHRFIEDEMITSEVPQWRVDEAKRALVIHQLYRCSESLDLDEKRGAIEYYWNYRDILDVNREVFLSLSGKVFENIADFLKEPTKRDLFASSILRQVAFLVKENRAIGLSLDEALKKLIDFEEVIAECPAEKSDSPPKGGVIRAIFRPFSSLAVGVAKDYLARREDNAPTSSLLYDAAYAIVTHLFSKETEFNSTMAGYLTDFFFSPLAQSESTLFDRHMTNCKALLDRIDKKGFLEGDKMLMAKFSIFTLDEKRLLQQLRSMEENDVADLRDATINFIEILVQNNIFATIVNPFSVANHVVPLLFVESPSHQRKLFEKIEEPLMNNPLELFFCEIDEKKNSAPLHYRYRHLPKLEQAYRELKGLFPSAPIIKLLFYKKFSEIIVTDLTEKNFPLYKKIYDDIAANEDSLMIERGAILSREAKRKLDEFIPSKMKG